MSGASFDVRNRIAIRCHLRAASPRGYRWYVYVSVTSGSRVVPVAGTGTGARTAASQQSGLAPSARRHRSQ